MELKIELQKGVEGAMTFSEFDQLCTDLSCTLEGKTAAGNWIISSDKPMSFYYLGGAMMMQIMKENSQ